MHFTSFIFLVFVMLFFPLYFYTKGIYRILACLVSSYIFYGWWDWRFLSLILLSTIIDYCIGLKLSNTIEQSKRKQFLIISIISNLSILGIFKYCNFFVESFIDFLNVFSFNLNSPTLNIILPIGISFYTFQTMSYTIDVYKKNCAAEKNFLRFAAYVALFPQLVAGPIVRAKSLLPQMKVDQQFEWERVLKGIRLVIWGYFLKLCVADRLAHLVEPAYASPDSFGGGVHILTTVAFSFQIYADFCGYSLIAIGIGKIMGFDFGLNFNKPYFSKSFSEFWERWHISLSSWLKDYLYIPLGGNRLGVIITFRNLVIVMFLGGLWHGAAWTYVIWGLLHGFYLILQHFLGMTSIDKRFRLVLNDNFYKCIKILVVFALVNIAWIFFRANDLDDAILILKQIISFSNYFNGIGYDLFSLIVGFSMVFFVMLIEILGDNSRIKRMYKTNIIVNASSMLVLLWLIAFLGVFEGTAFIYFQF